MEFQSPIANSRLLCSTVHTSEAARFNDLKNNSDRKVSRLSTVRRYSIPSPRANLQSHFRFDGAWQRETDGFCRLLMDSELLTDSPVPQMRDVLKTEELEIPQGVTVEIKSRVIKVTGPRGSLTKNVRHVDMDIRVVKAAKGKTKVTLAVWQGGRKHVACLNTIRSLINNMIIGVTKVCDVGHPGELKF
jgi:hypothetical protein